MTTERESKRVTIELKGSYRVFESDLPFCVITVVNISRTGICFATAEKILPDSLIELKIRLEDSREVRLLTMAIWSNPVYGEDMFRTGVKILDAQRPDAVEFTAFYQDHLQFPPNEKYIKG
jgi:hypothetical protein